MRAENATIDMGDVAKRMRITVHVTGIVRTQIRFWIGARLAARVMGVGTIEIRPDGE